MSTFEPQKRRITELMRRIHDGDLQLPEFQRDFKWNRRQRYHLLDSMQKNFPIGTLLFLELGPDSAAKVFKHRLLSGVDETGPASKQKPQELILDGQQRLTSLYRAFSRNSPEWTCLDVKALFEHVGLNEEVEIDLEEFLRPQKSTKSSENILFNKHFLPLFMTLPSEMERPIYEKLYDYKRSLEEHGHAELAEFAVKVLPSYLKVFDAYELPVVRLAKGLSISAIAGIFTELNNTGQRLTSFDLCVAKFYPKGIHLRDLLESSQQKLPHFEWLDSDGTSTLQVVAMMKSHEFTNSGEAKNVSSKKAKLVDALEAEWVAERWNEAAGAISYLGELMTKAGFTSSKTLPYDAVVPGLALGIHMSKTQGVKEASLVTSLRTFILSSGLTARYTEGTDSKRESDVAEFVDYAVNDERPHHLHASFNAKDLISTGLSGAKYKSFLALLNGLSATDPLNDTALGLDHPIHSQAELHHIFPKSHLEKISSKKVTRNKPWDSALNIMFLTPETNKWVSNDPPSTYIERIIANLTQSGKLKADAAERRLKKSFDSQLIDDEAWEYLKRDDFDNFLASRSRAVALKLQTLGVESEYSDSGSALDEED